MQPEGLRLAGNLSEASKAYNNLKKNKLYNKLTVSSLAGNRTPYLLIEFTHFCSLIEEDDHGYRQAVLFVGSDLLLVFATLLVCETLSDPFLYRVAQ